MGRRSRRTQNFYDHLPKLFGCNLTLCKYLGNITIVRRNWEDIILVEVGVSVIWRAHWIMAQMFIVLRSRFHWRWPGVVTISESFDIIESNDASLRPRKARRTVSVARLLGDNGGILKGQFSMLGQKEIVVVPSSPRASPSRIVGSSLVIPDFSSMHGGASGSPEDSCQRRKPSMIDGTRNSSHSLSFEG
ncbi:unnamed protein product [Lactuca saligna]|uniref:Uncharacterized protein n=1 Tax=Lactuca saligna TaxID=75948 RepID=A0AA36A4V7_LACSI|nr:unnamed protein product [Lactuca saligna]